MLVKELTERVSPLFTEEVLLEILKNKTSLSDIVIDELKLGAESKKGDSYLSIICRFSVNATGVNKNGEKESFFLPIITKAVPKNVGRRKTFRSGDFFETEIYFYEKVWPILLEFKKSKNVGGINEVPLVLGSQFDEANGYVALEDVSYQQFECIQRGNGLDYEHAVSLLKLLANFHGLSLACKDQNPQFVPVALALKETYFAERFRGWYTNFQTSLNALFCDAVEKELPPKYLERLNNLLKTDFFGTLCKLCAINGPLSVVSQGDTWIPNFLVKYGENRKVPKECLLLDFQLARYTTLSNDLAFFLYACVAEDILVSKWDDLVKEYHSALVKRVTDLGSSADLVTLDALLADIKENAVFAVGMSMEAIVMSLLNDNEVADLDMIQGDEEVPLESVWILPKFQDSERRKRAAFLIKHSVDRGFI